MTDKYPKLYLTDFEIAKIIGVRADQISKGAKPMINTSYTDSLQIAEEEFKQKKIPMSVIRTLPNGKVKEIKSDSWLVYKF